MNRKKQIQLKNLHTLDVLIKDPKPSSKYFKVLKDNGSTLGAGSPIITDEVVSLYIGKQVFYIEGSRLLKPHSDIKIEIIRHGGGVVNTDADVWESKIPADDEVIYSEVMFDYLSATRKRAVSVQVFEDDVFDFYPGELDCTLTIVGQLDPNKTHYDEANSKLVKITPEWENLYNVKWQGHFQIQHNPAETITNTKALIFKKNPKLLVQEVTASYADIITVSASDAWNEENVGNLTLTNESYTDINGNPVQNPDGYLNHFTFGQGTSETMPILSSSVAMTQTQSLQIPLVDEDLNANILPEFIQGFEQTSLNDDDWFTNIAFYSQSFVGTLRHSIPPSHDIDKIVLYGDHLSNNPNTYYNHPDQPDGEHAGQFGSTKIKPGVYLRIDNEIFLVGEGSTVFQESHEGVMRRRTNVMLNRNGYNNDSPRVKFAELSGIDSEPQLHNNGGGNHTHDTGSKEVYQFHPSPFMYARNSVIGIDTMDDASGETVARLSGSVMLKHQAYGDDAYFLGYTATDRDGVPIVDAFGGNEKYSVKGGETITFSIYCRGDGLGWHDLEDVDAGLRRVQLYLFFCGTNMDWREAYGGYGLQSKTFYIGTDWTKLEIKAKVPEGTKYVTTRIDNDGMQYIDANLYPTSGSNKIIGGNFSNGFSDWMTFWNSGSSDITFPTGYDGNSLRVTAKYDNVVRFDAQGTGYDITPHGEYKQQLDTVSNGWNSNMDGPLVYNSFGRGHRVTLIASESCQNGVWNGQYKHSRVYDTYGDQTWGDTIAELLDGDNLKSQTTAAYENFHGWNGSSNDGGENNYATASGGGWYKVQRYHPISGVETTEYLQDSLRPDVFPDSDYKMEFKLRHDGTIGSVHWITFFVSGGPDEGHHTVTPTVVDKGDYLLVSAVYRTPGGTPHNLDPDTTMTIRVCDFKVIGGTHTYVEIKDVSFKQVCQFGDEIETTDLLAVTSFDAVRYSSNLVTSLKSYGATDPKNVSGGGNLIQRTPYALLGQKGMGTGNGVEQVRSDAIQGPTANVTGWFTNGQLNPEGNVNAQTGQYVVGASGIYQHDNNHDFYIQKDHKYKLTVRARASKQASEASYLFLMDTDDGVGSGDNTGLPDITDIGTSWTLKSYIFTAIKTGNYNVLIGLDTRYDDMKAGDWVEFDDITLKDLQPSTVYWDDPKFHINYETKVQTVINQEKGSIQQFDLNDRNTWFKPEYDQRPLIGITDTDTGESLSPGQNLKYNLGWWNVGEMWTYQNYISYAQVDVIDMETWAGDVHKIKLSYRRAGTIGENWPNKMEEILENKEIFLDYDSELLQTRVGDFVHQEQITSSFYSPEGGYPLYDNTWKANSMKLNQVTPTPGSTTDNKYTIGTRWVSREVIPFQSGQTYNLTMNVRSERTAPEVNQNQFYQESSASVEWEGKPKLLVYLSGSKFDFSMQADEDTYEFDNPYGYPTIQYDNQNGGGYGKLIGKYEVDIDNFNPMNWEGYLNQPSDGLQSWEINVPEYDDNPDAASYLVFRVIGAGSWYLNNVSIVQAKETNLSPPNYRFYAPMPREIQDEKIEFKAEFYNPEEVLSTNKVISDPVDFAGGNLVFLGTSNLISGSFFIGAETGTGIEMGGVNSAYIRTVGYESYMSASRGESAAGFLLWSGSVFGARTDEYSGSGVDSVGFEFHGGSGSAGESSPGARDGKTNAIRFRTDTGKLEVTGTVAADAGAIGGWEIVDDLLSGSNVTMDAESSAIYKTDQPQDYFIDFTPGTGTNESGNNRASHYVRFGPNFGVRNDGTLVASGAKIEGVLTSSEGFIGGWKIESDTLRAFDSATDTPRNFLLSGSGVISSSNFYVDEVGNMTASSGWFIGTVTASVVESEEGNISGWILEPGVIRDEDDIIRLQPSGSSYVISSSDFQVSTQGKMTASAGKVAGWDINGSILESGGQNIRLDGNNKKITINSDTFGDDGIQLDYNSGTTRAHIGKHGSSGIKFDVNNGLELTSSKFELDTSGLDISTVSASIKVGSEDLSLDDGSGTFLSGSGEFKIGDSDGYIKFANDSLVISGADANINVTDLNISSSGFTVSSNHKSMSLGDNKEILLDADGGTGGIPIIKLQGGEISSSGFFVDSDGQVTASSGKIASWLIDENVISGNGMKLGKSNTWHGAGFTGLHFGHNNYWYSGSGNSLYFRVGDDDNSLSLTPSSFNLSTTNLALSASGLELSSNQKSMSLGDGREITLDGDGGTGNAPIIKLEGGEISSSGFFVSTIGEVTASSGLIAGFEVSASYLKRGDFFYLDGQADGTMDGDDHRYFISSSTFNVNHTGTVSGSLVHFNGGEIGGWKITSAMIEKSNKIYLNSGGTHGQIWMGSTGYSTAKVGFEGDGSGKLASGAINWDSSGNLNVTGSKVTLELENFDLDTPTMDIQSNTSDNNPKILIYSASAGEEIVRIGQIHWNELEPQYGMKIFNGEGTGSTQELVRLGTQGNRIGGWEITQGQFRTLPASGFGGSYAENEQGLVLHASGTIETADFVSNVKGWRISSEGNGTAEFENAKIRGTLATTVFEKESVNVVGGQLMVANSTQIGPLRSGSEVLAGDVTMSVSQTTMSVQNVSGFAVGEVLKVKKVGDTGFSTEYMYVSGSQRYITKTPISESISSSLAGTSIDPDGLYGELYVERAYGSNQNVSSSVATVNEGGGLDTTQTDITVNTSNVFAVQDVIKIDDERMKITSIPDSTSIIVVRDFQDTVAATHSNGAAIWKINTDVEFLQGLISTAQEYNEGQVIVSTGVYDPANDISSGYLLMNANPRDISTPYMDIIERTGSGPYDVQLRGRFGDLSGLSSGYLYGDEEPGFGIFTNNGFFRGKLTAETGSFTGILHVATGDNDMKLGISASGVDNHGIHINDHNYVYNDGVFKFGKNTQYIQGNNNVEIKSTGFHLNTDGSVTSSAGKIADWNITSTNINKNHVFLDSTNQALLVKNSTDAKNIIKVGNGSFSSVAGTAELLSNKGFEDSSIVETGSINDWNSRLKVTNAFSINETNKYLEQWITGSHGASGGSRGFRIILEA